MDVQLFFTLIYI